LFAKRETASNISHLSFTRRAGLLRVEIDIPAAQAASEFVQLVDRRERSQSAARTQNPSHTGKTLRHNNSPGICFIFEKPILGRNSKWI
jgi:hypothetical protein